MIGPNDLRDIVHEDATEAPIVQANQLLAGIEHKVKLRRRARLAGAFAAVVVVLVAGLAIVPRFVDTSSPEPVEPIPHRPHLEFPQRVNGVSVLASQVNPPGDSALEWTTSLSRVVDAEMIVFCRIPPNPTAAPDPASGRIVLVVAINNDIIATRACTQLTSGKPAYPPRNGEVKQSGWLDPRSHQVVGGEPFSVSIWLQQSDDQVELPRAEFGIGFYEPAVSHRGNRQEGIRPELPESATGD